MHAATPAQQNVVRIIQDEHESLAAVIRGMQYFVRMIDQGKKAPDLRVFRAMLLYMNDYPERVHHPKEDRFLFARLRQRTPEFDLTLAELEFQHARGAGLIHDIERALARYEFEGPPAFPAFFGLIEDFGSFYTTHIRLEEEIILPAAVRFLAEQDWLAIDAGFSDIRDQMTGVLIRNDFAKLFSLIVDIDPGSAAID